MDHADIAEAVRQGPPRHAGAVTIHYGFDKQAIVPCRSAYLAFSTGEPILNPFPRVVPQTLTFDHHDYTALRAPP